METREDDGFSPAEDRTSSIGPAEVCESLPELGFREIPNDEQPNLRYLTFGHTWLILSDLHAHGYHNEERGRAVRTGPLGNGFVLSIPTTDLDATYEIWKSHGLPVTLEPEDAGFARIFYGLDPDGYDVTFEQFRSG